MTKALAACALYLHVIGVEIFPLSQRAVVFDATLDHDRDDIDLVVWVHVGFPMRHEAGIGDVYQTTQSSLASIRVGVVPEYSRAFDQLVFFQPGKAAEGQRVSVKNVHNGLLV